MMLDARDVTKLATSVRVPRSIRNERTPRLATSNCSRNDYADCLYKVARDHFYHDYTHAEVFASSFTYIYFHQAQLLFEFRAQCIVQINHVDYPMNYLLGDG